MQRNSPSKKLYIEEFSDASEKIKHLIKNLSIGSLIKMIRTQLGISQKSLAKLSGVPQPTISKIEQGLRDVKLSTLNKILNAISCDVVVVPLLKYSIDSIRKRQARKLAEKRVAYLKGTMNLENQEPDPKFIEELIKEEEERLLGGPNYKLWQDCSN